jgi:hypothetical protein
MQQESQGKDVKWDFIDKASKNYGYAKGLGGWGMFMTWYSITNLV